MGKTILNLSFLIFTTVAWLQSGHIMQGVGAVNMSMGGAATAQPLDISGALQWNPATLSALDDKILKFDIGLFFSSPQLGSTIPEFDTSGQPTGNFYSGKTFDYRGISPMPALAMVWGNEGSEHAFGASAFGISGFGVTFPESTTNPITMPQSMGGFGRIKSDYVLLQIGLTYAYEISDQFSIGIEPTMNYATVELMPNPTANPSATGYPYTDKATALGFGAQIGLFYDSGSGFKAGASYKSTQSFGDFEFDNTYLDNSTGTNNFNMDYPAIYSLGLGYSLGDVDWRWIIDWSIMGIPMDFPKQVGRKQHPWPDLDGKTYQLFPPGSNIRESINSQFDWEIRIAPILLVKKSHFSMYRLWPLLKMLSS